VIPAPAAAAADPFLDPAHLELASRVESFVRDRLRPAAIDEEAPGAALRMLDLLAAGGLLDHAVPSRYGGASETLDLRAICVTRSVLARGSGLADALFVMQALGSHPLLLAGTETLREALLPGLRRGEQAAAFALTEPGAGSDLGAIATTARRDGDDYVLEGAKWLISNAGFATFYTVLARTDGEGDPRRALSFFLVEDDRPGLTARPQRLLSSHPVGELRFEGCRVPSSHRLGEEGEGLAVALRTLNFFRPSVGAAACGFAARALDESLRWVAARRQFGRTLADFQGVQHRLADMATELEASRMLVHRAAAEQDRGQGRPEAAAMAKLYATEAAGRICDAAVQLHGGAGLLAGSAVERLYREVRALRIYEGTSEVQRNLIARELLRR
jgi:acyl-CoA dehydrogenase